MSRILIAVTLLFGMAVQPSSAQVSEPEEPPVALTVGQVLSDSLAATDAHSYTIDLAAGQFVYGEVDQRTVDVVVTVYAPAGQRLEAFDASARGPEPLQFTSGEAGIHRIDLAPFEEASGSYGIVLERLEPVATTPVGRIDQIMAAYDAHVPGCAIGVYHDGEMAHARGYGMADLEHDVPIAPHSVFDIASTSKQFT